MTTSQRHFLFCWTAYCGTLVLLGQIPNVKAAIIVVIGVLFCTVFVLLLLLFKPLKK
jgi:hypothetical protein